MPFCASCGSSVDGAFCPKCGSPVGAAAPSAPPPPYGTAPPPPYGAAPASAPLADNVAAALCYSLGFITGILFLVLAPYNQNRTIKFHAFQSIFMNVACIIFSIVAHGLLIVMHLWEFGFLISLACFCLWLFLIIQAYQGKLVVLPVIGPIAQQQAR
jgi:uncharacterized membrane protein